MKLEEAKQTAAFLSMTPSVQQHLHYILYVIYNKYMKLKGVHVTVNVTTVYCRRRKSRGGQFSR